MSGLVTVFGASYSVYVRAVRRALEEKSVAYTLQEVDVFGADRGSASALKRQPFGKIPSFEHDGFALFETTAINRYVDEAFPGPALQPVEPKLRARMNQIISILDSYLYRSMVWGVYMHRPEDGAEALSSGVEATRRAMAEIGAILGTASYLHGGGSLTLADLHAYPMFRYAAMKPEGEALMSNEFPRIGAWFQRMTERASVRATLFPKEL